PMSSAQPARTGTTPETPETPEPRIRIEPIAGTARATLNNQIVAESTAALVLREGSYPPRVYFPMSDVRMDQLTATDKSTHCPHKGDASYWTVVAGGAEAPDVAWAYRTPIDEVGSIKDHICFADPVVTEA
ncbi:MAG: DUF427 domain-containing protein, partial [Lysobacterales bacterium]